MRNLSCLMPVVTAVLAGCAAGPAGDLQSTDAREQAQIRRRLEAIFDAAEKKEMDRLDSYHLYGPKFTKFSGGSLIRQDAAVARKGEHVGLAAINDLSMRADDLKIDVFDDVAVATFVARFSFKAGGKTIRKRESSTMVFVKERGAWKIAHEHFSSSVR